MVKKTAPDIRFWRHVQKGAPEQCWPWLGEKTWHGYGRFTLFPTAKYKGTKVAHRLAWEYTRGPIPKNLECCHRCDNKPCCNPAHLFIGTHKENMEDMAKKGRGNAVRGTMQGSSKLTDKQVIQIRLMYAPGVISMLFIAKLFCVSERTIYVIVHRLGWKHIP